MGELNTEREPADSKHSTDAGSEQLQGLSDRPADVGAAVGEQALWQMLRSGDGREARLALIYRYEHLVHQQTETINRSTERTVDDRELTQVGVLALLKAIEQFDSAGSMDFTTFAGPLIQATMRQAQESGIAAEAASPPLRAMRAERARALHGNSRAGTANDPFSRLVELTLGLAVGHLLEGNAYADDGKAASVTGSRGELSVLSASVRQMMEALAGSFRTIVSLHYTCALPFQGIGELCGLSTAEVSKQHADAIWQLRERQLQMGSLSLLC